MAVNRIEFNKKAVKLTDKEYDLFYLLNKNRGKLVTREVILKKIWGNMILTEEFANSIRVLIFYLRKKLGKKSIRCVPRRGYVLV